VPPRTTPAGTTIADPGAASWSEQLLQRIRHRFWLKVIGVSGFTWLFFIAYFHLLRNPVRPVIPVPMTALDHAIGHQAWAFWAYVSLWFYVGIAPGLMLRLRDLLLHGAWAASLCATGLLVFYLMPTAVPPHTLSPELASHPGFALLQGVDAAGNALPSLHVATALFSAAWVQRLLRCIGAPAWLDAVNGAWLLLIVYSTMAIKQHVLLDVVAGALLGGFFAWASLRSLPRSGAAPGDAR
jgi:membrane-associated phospholipid phosphatase